MMEYATNIYSETQRMLDQFEALIDPKEKDAFIYKNTIKLRCNG